MAEGYVKADEWHYLNQHWTAVLQDARNDPNNVLCMYHHKETGCLIQGCPFKHPSEVPLDLAAAVKKMKKQVASSPDEGSASRSFQPPAQGCCQCGTSGVKLFRCKQCNGMDARYCSRCCCQWPSSTLMRPSTHQLTTCIPVKHCRNIICDNPFSNITP